MSYILPNKDLLEKNSKEIEGEDRYYNLSKLVYKKDNEKKLLFPIGIDKEHEKYYIDFEEKTSILIEGETGSGKSVFLNSIIISLLLKNTPEELQFVFIDPRNIELSLYNEIPHLYKETASSVYESLDAIKYIIDIINERKDLFSKQKVKNIHDYNEKADDKLPQVLLVVDEAADLLNIKETEDFIYSIIPDGYRYGIHIIIATNSYIKNVFNPKMIEQFDYIITFDLATEEQATLIKINGSNLLTVYGEALIKLNNNDQLYNVQTPYISIKDIKAVTEFINSNKNTNN